MLERQFSYEAARVKLTLLDAALVQKVCVRLG